MSKSHEVTVAHALYAYQVDGRERIALRGEQIEVSAADFETGSAAGAFVVPAEPEPEKPLTVEELLEQIGEDKDLAQVALDEENAAAKPRKTLVAELEKILAAE